MREHLGLLLLLLSISFSPAASFPPEPAPGADPTKYLLLKLEEGKEGIVGAQLADGDSLVDLGLAQSQFGNELKLQSDYQEVKLGEGRLPAHTAHLNTKTDTILDSIEGSTGGETSHHQDDFLDITKNGLEVNQKALDILDQIRDQEADDEGRKCVKKLMMREETVYEEVMTCHHSYDERCHDSYITTYEPHQEEECDEKFRKVCTIWYEEKAISEMVEECTTPVVSDCQESERKEDCRTVYDTICDTRQVGYEVEEDFPNCTTVNMEKCEDVTVGLKTERKCEVWPTQRCTVDTKKVQHSSPNTECRKEPRKMCAPPGCTLVQGPVSCLQKMKTVLVDSPQETCDLLPQKSCKFVTKVKFKLTSSDNYRVSHKKGHIGSGLI